MKVMKVNSNMNNNVTLCASATVLALTFNDIYLIIVGISILVSTIIAIVNAIKSNKEITIDKTTQEQLKKIDEELSKSEKENK